MGHYWSEMQGDAIEKPRHPTPLEAMGFFQPYAPPFYNAGVEIWVHRPCAQLFYIQNGRHSRTVPDAIYRHVNRCDGG